MLIYKEQIFFPKYKAENACKHLPIRSAKGLQPYCLLVREEKNYEILGVYFR